MNSDLEEIKSRLNIVDVLGEYIRLEKAGANWRARCPFHNEKTPSFMVSEDKQIWHCFGCQKGGDIFGFIMEIEGMEFKEALKLLAEKAGIELKKVDPKYVAEKNKVFEILELATKFYETQLWKGAGKDKITAYIKERGIKDETAREFRLGYAPKGWKNILKFLTERGFAASDILKTGLLVEKTASLSEEDKYYDRFRDRIIFPINDANGKVVGFSARVAPGGDESQAKYVNTPETEVYHKSKVLYGINKAKAGIRKKDFALLVEGNMDVIACHQAGLDNAAAVSGTALTDDQLNTIKRYASKVKMFFDMDSAGENATKKSIQLCFAKDINVEVVQLPSGKDAADLAKDDPEELKKAVENSLPAMEYLFKKTILKYDKNKVSDKKSIVEELLPMIEILANELEKSHWIKKLASELETQETVLTDMLKKARLRDRVIKPSTNVPGEISEFLPRKKLETLTDDLIGLMLVYGDVWEKLEKEEISDLPKDSLLNALLQRGAELHFDFDKAVKFLENPEDIAKAERVFFEKKYRVGLDNQLEEVIISDPVKEAAGCLKEIKKEIKKEKLEGITQDLKIAEEAQDKEALAYLRNEFKKISEEITELNQ